MSIESDIVMAEKEQRKQFIRTIADILRETPFTVEFEVKEKPTGIRIIYEVTKEQLDAMIKAQCLTNNKNEQ